MISAYFSQKTLSAMLLFYFILFFKGYANADFLYLCFFFGGGTKKSRKNKHK